MSSVQGCGKINSDLNISISNIVKNKYLVIVVNRDELSSFYVNHGDDILLPDPKETIGEKFIGWSHDGKNITEPITIKANFKDQLINVEYETNGGNNIDSQSFFYLDTLPEVIPYKEGYTFKGWYIDEELTQEYQNSLLKDDLILYAKWEKNSGCNNVNGYIFYIYMLLIPLYLIKKFKK